MIGLEQVEQVRTMSRPMTGYWSGENWEAPGTLYWEDGEPILKLFFHSAVDDCSQDLKRSRDPVMQSLMPPNQPLITGVVQGYGTIALEGCASVNTNRTQALGKAGVDYVLTIQPSVVWLGNSPQDNLTVVRLQDTRLGGFFGTSGVRVLEGFDNAEAFALMGNPHRVMAIDAPALLKVNLGQSEWQMVLDTETTQGTSAVEGHTVQSVLSLKLLAPYGATRTEVDRCAFELETIFSTFSLEPFSFQYRCYADSKLGREAHLVWQLGQDQRLFTPPMRHQVLVDFSDPTTFTAIVEQWFNAEGDTRLARWLFGRALTETSDGLARFVSVAQAFEVLARARGRSKVVTTERMAVATLLIADALSAGNFDPEFVERTKQLVASSNRASFQDSLMDIMGGLNQRYELGNSEEILSFCQNVVATRNTVVHMTDKPKAQLNDAFGRVNKLGSQLCRWFALQVATDLDVTIPDLAVFLVNNRVSRMGLANKH